MCFFELFLNFQYTEENSVNINQYLLLCSTQETKS